MSDAPERIDPGTDVSRWVYENGLWSDEGPGYIRADLYQQQAERIAELEEALAAANYDWNKDPDNLAPPPSWRLTDSKA